MYRVLLAEDELNVLNAMKEAIRWQEHGFETPLCCGDGREAIQAMAEGYMPDVILTDICMPFADGLELTAYVNEHQPEAVVVILSGYDDFKYAQQAVKLRVLDYILKPVTPHQLCELLDKLRAELDERRRSRNDGSHEIMVSHFFNRLISQPLDSRVIEEQADSMGLRLDAAVYGVATLDVDMPQAADTEAARTLDCLRFGLFNVAAELFEESAHIWVFQGPYGMTKLLVGEAGSASCADVLRRTAEKAARRAAECLDCSVSAGIGAPVERLEALPASHSQSRQALEERFYQGQGRLFVYENSREPEADAPDTGLIEQRFLAAVRQSRPEETQRLIDSLTDRMRAARTAPDDCFSQARHLLLQALPLVSELAGESEAAALRRRVERIHPARLLNLDEIAQALRDVCGEVFRLLREAGDGSASLVRRATEYIREQYANPSLSLSDVTAHLAVSTSYFSPLFKAGTGMTFVEYVTGVRMEKAREILALTGRRSYEIAEDVGFSDPHYFSAAFKKATGVTPREYREQSRRDAADAGR